MAERRMLHRKASVSRTWPTCERHGGDAVAFFLLLIPHLDRYGCAPADPIRLRGMVIPLWTDVSDGDLVAWVRWLLRRRMLERVRDQNGGKGLRATGFHDLQTGAHLEREAPSKYEPPDWVRTSPDQVRARKEVKKEGIARARVRARPRHPREWTWTSWPTRSRRTWATRSGGGEGLQQGQLIPAR